MRCGGVRTPGSFGARHARCRDKCVEPEGSEEERLDPNGPHLRDRSDHAGLIDVAGFGLRAVKDEAVGYAHASDISHAALARAADAVQAVKGGYSGTYADAPPRSNVRLYGDDNPLAAPGFDAKVKLLEEINAYARAKDPRVRQVSASLAATWQSVEIIRPDGQVYRDIRPLVRMHISIVAGDNTLAASVQTASGMLASISPMLIDGYTRLGSDVPCGGQTAVFFRR